MLIDDLSLAATMDQSDGDDHAHCESCYRVKCWGKAASLTRCPVVPCPLRCGAKFHACKLDDHKDLCGLEKVGRIYPI